MPTTIIQFPGPGGDQPTTAILKQGKKRTVRFLSRPTRPTAPRPAPRTEQERIDGARITAGNLRRLAAKATNARWRKSMEDAAARWEAIAAKLTSTQHGPQQPPGGLFQ